MVRLNLSREFRESQAGDLLQAGDLAGVRVMISQGEQIAPQT
jgi:hypothetical protein